MADSDAPTARAPVLPWRRLATLVLVALALTPVIYRLCWRGERPPSRSKNNEAIVEIHHMAWGNPQQLETERAVIAQFNNKCIAEGKNIRVQLFMPPAGGYPQRLLMMLASGTAPDVCRVDHYNFAGMAAKGYFRDITDIARSDPTFSLEAFHPVPMRENYYNHRLYGLNVLFGGVLCYYNKDLFRRSGLNDPYELWRQGKWTWAAFDDAATRLTTRDAAGRTLVFGYSVYINANGPNCPPPTIWALWLWREGADFLSPDGARCTLDSPAAVRAFQHMRDMIFVNRVCPTPAQTLSNLYTFETGNVAMYLDFAGMAPRYRDTVRDFEWDIAPTPSDPDNSYTIVKGNQLCITSQSKHPSEAWEWVKYLTGREAELYMCGERYRRSVPTRLDLLSSPDYLQAKTRPFQIDVYVDLINRGRELPLDEAWWAWTSTAHRSLDRLFVGASADTQQALTAAARAADVELVREHERYRRYTNDRPSTAPANAAGVAHAE